MMHVNYLSHFVFIFTAKSPAHGIKIKKDGTMLFACQPPSNQRNKRQTLHRMKMVWSYICRYAQSDVTRNGLFDQVPCQPLVYSDHLDALEETKVGIVFLDSGWCL